MCCLGCVVSCFEVQLSNWLKFELVCGLPGGEGGGAMAQVRG